MPPLDSESSAGAKDFYDLAWAFPEVDPGHRPVASYVLVQIPTPRITSGGGIILPTATRETEYDNTQVGKVVAIGPLAFCRRDTAEPWPEGEWYKIGDFVRVPKYGGDRVSVKITRTVPQHRRGMQTIAEEQITEDVVFAQFNDRDIRMVITGDPLAVRAFML